MAGEAQKTKVGRNKEEKRIEKGKERRRKRKKKRKQMLLNLLC